MPAPEPRPGALSEDEHDEDHEDRPDRGAQRREDRMEAEREAGRDRRPELEWAEAHDGQDRAARPARRPAVGRLEGMPFDRFVEIVRDVPILDRMPEG